MLTSLDHQDLSFAGDSERAVIALMTQWRNCHARYRVCSKRINWSLKHASRIEKKRRREKWELVARILEIENTIVHWCAKKTKHKDIYTPPKLASRKSKLMVLRHSYDENRRVSHHLTSSQRKLRARMRDDRKAIVAEMRAITRIWMEEVYHMVFGYDHTPPKPLPLHPAELVPRKLKKAQKRLREELAA